MKVKVTTTSGDSVEGVLDPLRQHARQRHQPLVENQTAKVIPTVKAPAVGGYSDSERDSDSEERRLSEEVPAPAETQPLAGTAVSKTLKAAPTHGWLSESIVQSSGSGSWVSIVC